MRLFARAGLLWLGLIVFGVVGWIMNVISLIGMLGDSVITPMFIARIVGIFLAPFGAILGYF